MSNYSVLPRTSSPGKRWFRRFLVLFSVLLVLLISLPVLVYFYQDEVKQKVLARLNQHLNAEVKVNPTDIDITILSTFPDCSLRFSNVLMLEAIPSKKRDTLAFIGRINLHFNVRDLWNGNYTIKTISCRDAVLKPKELKDGSNNYTFWKKSSASEGEDVSFLLEKVEVKNARIVYMDENARLNTSMHLDQLRLKGQFSSEAYLLESSARFVLREYEYHGKTYLQQKMVSYKTSLDVKGDDYRFRNAEITLNDLLLKAEGGFRYKSELSDVSVRFQARELSFSSLLSLLPEEQGHRIKDYESSGALSLEGTLKSRSAKQYSLDMNMQMANGTLKYKVNQSRVENVNFMAGLHFSEKESSFTVKKLSLNSGKEYLQAALRVENFDDPKLDLNINARLDLEELQNFWPLDSVIKLSGKVSLDGSIAGMVKDIRKQVLSDRVKINFQGTIKELALQLKHDEHESRVRSCEVMCENRQITVNDLLLQRGSSDLLISGRLPGLFNYLLDRNNNKLIIHGSLVSSRINIEDFIGKLISTYKVA